MHTGLILAAEKESAIVKAMRDDYRTIPFTDAQGCFASPPCPVLQTAFLKKRGYDPKDLRQQTISGLTIYPGSFFASQDEAGLITFSKETYAIHYGMSSWYPYPWRVLRQVRIGLSFLFGPRLMRLLIGCKRKLLPGFRVRKALP